MKILVTGGAGFIGTNFIRFMLDKYGDKINITNLDKLTYCGNLENLNDIEDKSNYSFIEGDIADYELLKSAVEDSEIIFNFAAETHVDRSIRNSIDFVHSNVLGCTVLLEFIRKNPGKKLVHISTDEVYGSISRGSFTEESNLSPNSPYAATKASGDLIALSYARTYNLPIIITRSTNNFGPFQYPEKFIPLVITNLLENKKIPLYGDGLNVRDWIYTEDNCEAIDLLSKKGKIGEIYNIAGNNEEKNIDVAKFILKELGKDEKSIEFVKDRPAHDKRYSLDCNKIKTLGFKPKHEFTSALRQTIKWYKENKSWWEKLKNKKSYNTDYY